jgi:hypothetical protein
VDFKDLNRVSPKDDFSLPHINVFIDNVIKSYIYTSMDNFLRYNKKNVQRKHGKDYLLHNPIESVPLQSDVL